MTTWRFVPVYPGVWRPQPQAGWMKCRASEAVLEPEGPQHVRPQPSAVERPQGVADQRDPRARHELEAERAVDLVIALVRYVGGLHGPPEGRVVGDRPRQPEFALADLKLRHQVDRQRGPGC